MAEKIDSLTKEQEGNLKSYYEECLKIGRSTKPADRPAAETALKKMYSLLGKKEPFIWWVDGPASGSIIRTLLNDKNAMKTIGDNLGDNLRDNLGANLWANLGANLGANLRANLGDNLRANLWANLGDNLRANLGDNLRANLRANLGDNLRANLGDNLDWPFWGQQELYWQAFYDWPDINIKAMHNIDQREKLDLWLTLSKSCGWWQPYENIVFVCERPKTLNLDERGRLHSLNGPAFEYRDGYFDYFVHGINVKPYIIEFPEQITIELIDAEANTEIRRIMIDRYQGKTTTGAAGYAIDSGSKVVDVGKDDHPVMGLRGSRLLRREIDGDEPIVIIECINSTHEDGTEPKQYETIEQWLADMKEQKPWLVGNKLYHIRVDPNAYNGMASKDVWAAMASTWRYKDGSFIFENYRDYCPEIET
jgi:hypothetical protein